MQLSKKAEL